MAGRNKNRIVIDLNQPRTTPLRSGSRAASHRRRWPKVLAVLAGFCIVLVLVVGAALFFWWRHYQTTPAYALALVVDAAQRDDVPAFRSGFDEEQISRNLVVKVREKASARYGVTISDSLQRSIDSLLASLLPQMTDRVHAELATEIKQLSSRWEAKPFLFVALGISSLMNITTEGDRARAIAPVGERTIEVSLRRDGDRWKIIDFKDDVLVQRVVDGIMKDLPAIGTIDLKIPLLKSQKPRRRNR